MTDWFSRNFGSPIAVLADIRQRVVEEPTYGKVVTPRAHSITVTSPEKSPGEGLGWFQRDFAPDPARQQDGGDRDIHGNEHAQEHGRER